MRDAAFPVSVDQDAIDASMISVTGSPGTAAGHQVFAKVESCGDAIVGARAASAHWNAASSLSVA